MVVEGELVVAGFRIWLVLAIAVAASGTVAHS